MRWYQIVAMVAVGTVLIYGTRMAHAMTQPRLSWACWVILFRDWWRTRGRDAAC